MKATQGTVIMVALVGLLLLFSNTATATTMDAMERNRLMAVNYLGKSSYPRGMRNNNPGNLRISSSSWKGKVPTSKNTDGAFEQFDYYVWGVRAMIVLLRNYINRNGLTTIRKIMSKYAPPSENHTDTYAKWVAQKSGIGIDQPLVANQQFLRPLVKAMAHYENGQEAVEDDMFTLAYVIS